MTQFLNDFTSFVRQQNKHLFSVTELRGGISASVTLCPAPRCQNTYSISKLFTTTAVGMLCDEGRLSTSDRVTELLRDLLPSGTDPRWETLTVDYALRHRLGMRAGFMDIDAADTCAFGKDHLTCLFTSPFERDPGQEFVYTDAAFYLLARVVEKVSGQRIDDFLWERLFFPLSFREAAWSKCPLGHPMGATGLYLATEDVAKLGELYRTGGVWQGRRILSEAWVKTAIQAPYELYPIGKNAYGKGGMFGQMLMVIPEAQRVVAWSAFEEDCGPLLKFCAEYRD